jgi:hypothetical protein
MVRPEELEEKEMVSIWAVPLTVRVPLAREAVTSGP